MAVNKLGQLSFNDVAADPGAEAADKPVTIVAETFDNLVYTLKLKKTAKGDDYFVTFTVTGEPPKSRTVEKGEKPQDKERRDKEFAETRKRLENRIAFENVLGKWTYVIARGELEPLLRSRSEMTVPKRDSKKEGPGK